MSRLLLRLRTQLACATQLSERIELSALIALQLARMGAFEESQEIILSGRSLFGSGEHGIGTLWIMLAEGVFHLFKSQSPKALDRITRAQILALSYGHRRLIANTSAWKAHIEFERSDFEKMCDSLKIAKLHADDEDHEAQVRLAIVISNSFAFCGEASQAKKWFSYAHRHAIANLDQASLDAVIYNNAALHLAQLRVQDCIEKIDRDSVRGVRLEVQSSANFTSLVKGGALKNHLELIEARLLMLEGHYKDAAAALRHVRSLVPFAANHLNQHYVDLELCYCDFQAGQETCLEVYVNDDRLLNFSEMDLDEQVVAAHMLRQLSALDPRIGDCAKSQDSFETLVAQYEHEKCRLLSRLKFFVI